MHWRNALALALLCAAPALQAADRYPGYGVVQSITPIGPEQQTQSASAGSSSPRSTRPAAHGYLIKVKMDDGRYQIRQVEKKRVRVGERVLVTNVGDVLPE